MNLKNKENGKSLSYLPDNCVVVDIETTGFSAINDSIIEICALKIENNKIKEEFSSLVNPKRPIPFFISKLTGIKDEMVKNAPEIDVVLKKFCNFAAENPIVGHNIKFDLRFLNKKLEIIGSKALSNSSADTLIFAKKVYNLDSHKLTNIARHLNIDPSGAHRALKDCYITFEIMKDIKRKLNGLN